MSIKMLLQTLLVKSNYIGLKLARFFFFVAKQAFHQKD